MDQQKLAKEMLEVRANCQNFLKQRIDYDELIQEYPEETIKEMVDLMTDTMCSQKPIVKVAGQLLPLQVLWERFLSLEPEHIRFVMENMKKSTGTELI